MDQCEFLDVCYFVKNSGDDGLKEEYCNKNPLRCARFMIYQGADASKVPDDLKPDEKTKAYEVLASC